MWDKENLECKKINKRSIDYYKNIEYKQIVYPNYNYHYHALVKKEHK